MRHRKDGRRLGRNSSHRKAMMRNLVSSLLEHGRIKTTEARAKEVRRVAEKLVTIGKKALRLDAETREGREQRVHYYRQLLKVVRSKDIARKVMDTYASRFEERPGGYTRIIKLGFRQGDNAPVAFIEMLGEED